MKKILFIFMMLNCFTSANPLGGNPTNGYCQTIDGSACGWGGGGSSSRRVYKIPNRWGVIYYNPTDDAVGYSENNTEGYRPANKETLANCIQSGRRSKPTAQRRKGSPYDGRSTQYLQCDCCGW